MRSSYINYFYANNDKTMKEKEKLANVMRHSVTTAQRNYLKIDKNKPQTEQIENKHISPTERKKEDILKEIQKLQDELKLLNLKDDEETIKPIDKAYIKKRRDVLYTLNKKGVQPKEDTLIKKYNIKYDKTTKTYI